MMPDAWWTPTGWLLLGGGVLLILWAWLRGVISAWRRTRRRCPKCWYDLSHTDGLRCSECGHTARREKHLYRCRRRWWLVLPGLLLLLGVYPSFRAPAIRAHGWEATVPTTVIIAFLPMIERPAEESRTIRGRIWTNPRPAPSPTERVMEDLRRRCDDDALWAWQWKFLVERMLRDDPHRLLSRTIETGHFWSFYGELLNQANDLGHVTDEQLRRADAEADITIDVAPAWPIGSTIYARIWPDYWGCGDLAYTVIDRPTGRVITTGYDIDMTKCNFILVNYAWHKWDDWMKPIGVAKPGHNHLALTIEMRIRHDGDDWNPLKTFDVDVPICMLGAIEDYVEVRPSTEIDHALQSLDGAVLHEDGRYGPWLAFDPEPIAEQMDAVGVRVLATTLKVLDGETLIASGQAWWSIRSGLFGDGLYVEHSGTRIRMKPTVHNLNLQGRTDLRLRITGDPYTALRAEDHTTCWDGMVELPLEVAEGR